MSSASHLLPPNATQAERALSEATARMGMSAVDIGISALWRPWDCPVYLLPWLAWALSVDEWNAAWDEQVKRQVIDGSIERRRKSGTVWALRQAIVAAGWPNAKINERAIIRYNGQYIYDGTQVYGSPEWAIFQVVLDDEPSPEDIVKLTAVIDAYKNARSHLSALIFRNEA